MRKRIRIAVSIVLLIGSLGASTAVPDSDAVEPAKFFREFVGLGSDQIRDIRAGKAIAKVLESPTPDEVFVFGAVFINSTPERYLKLASDLDALRKLPNYLALREFSTPPQLADLNGFALDEADVKDLQRCKPGHCDVQLPSSLMEQFQQSVNWFGIRSLRSSKSFSATNGASSLAQLPAGWQRSSRNLSR